MNDFRRAVNWVKTRAIILAGAVKGAKFNSDGNPAVTSDINNITVVGNNRQNVIHVFPYGFMSVPKNGVNAVILNTGESGGNPLVIATIVGFDKDKLPYKLQPGDSFNFSDNWLLVQQNDAVKAYKIDDKNYSATLCSGEWLGKYLTNILNRLEAVENYLNTHTHTKVQSGTDISGIPNPIMPDPNIAKDKKSIKDEEYLINDRAKPTVTDERDIEFNTDF